MSAIEWHTRFTLAQDASQATKKPMLLDFYNPQ